MRFKEKVDIKMKHILIVSAALVMGLSAAPVEDCQGKEQKYLDSVAAFNTADYNQKNVAIRTVKTNLDALLRCENIIDVTVYKKHAMKVDRLLARYVR